LKIFLLEYITGGGFNKHTLPNALLQEGLLMRDALLRDFSGLADIEVVTTYDVRLDKPELAIAISVDSNANPISIWQTLLTECDAALIVAPETDHILTDLTQILTKSAVCNLGCNLHAVVITSNKFDTFKSLKNDGILTIETHMLDAVDASYFETLHNGFVVKPIDGAGCENTLYFQCLLDLKEWIDTKFLQPHQMEKLIVQPYMAGQPASISALFKKGKAWVLSCNVQKISMQVSQSKQMSMEYAGSTVNGLTEFSASFDDLVNKIAKALPDLNGYVGIDVIIHNQHIYVVEINPRITTSYIGLRESLSMNPAALILELASNENFKLPQIMTRYSVNIELHA